MKNIFKKITVTAIALATIPTISANALYNYDEGETLPIIEGNEIAEFFDNTTPTSFENFYLTTDAKMYGLNNIVSLGELWRITDGGYYSESGKVWILFNDNNTYNFEDDEIIQIFEAPTNDSEELAIYEEIYNNLMQIR